MATYVLDFVTGEYRDYPPSQGTYACNMWKYYFKIDTYGNVHIKEQGIGVCSGHSNQYYNPTDLLVINDNIPIPSYLIDTLKPFYISNADYL